MFVVSVPVFKMLDNNTQHCFILSGILSHILFSYNPVNLTESITRFDLILLYVHSVRSVLDL